MKTTQATDAALILGTALRLTRLVTSDTMGDRYVRRPVEQWAHTYATVDAPPAERYPDGTRKETLPEFLAGGLGCPACVGFWLGGAVLASYAVAKKAGHLRGWRALAAPFALNYVVFQVSSRLD